MSDYFNTTCDVLKIIIIVIVGFIFFKAVFTPIGSIGLRPYFYTPEPWWTISTLLILGIFILVYFLGRYSYSNEENK